jgi:anti-anti-sigma factor
VQKSSELRNPLLQTKAIGDQMSGVRRQPAAGEPPTATTKAVAMAMLMISQDEGTPLVLRVRGELDLLTAEELRTALEDAIAKDARVVVDLDGVTFVDACGLRVILEVAESLNGDGPLRIANARMVERLLRIVGLGSIPSISISPEA